MLNMRIARALVWEQWRISRVELLMRLALVLGGLLLFSVAGRNLKEAELTVLRGIFTFMFGFTALFSASWTSDFDNRQLGFTHRLGFTRPIATRWLVLVPILYSLCWSQLYYFGSALAIYLLTGLVLPLAGPAVIIACTVCMLIAGAWSSTRIDGRIVGMVGAVSMTLAWLSLRDYWLNDPDPILLSVGKVGYFDLVWYEYLGLAVVSSCSIVWTILAVDRQRHGESLMLPIFGQRAGGGLLKTGNSTRNQTPGTVGSCATIAKHTRVVTFNSAVAAQFWYEARRSTPLTLSACGLMPTLLFAFLCVDFHWMYSPRVWLAASLVIPVILQFLASDSVLGITHRQGAVRLSSFDATRPMRCDQLIAIKILVVFAWSVCGGLLVTLFAGLYAVLSGEFELWLHDLHAIAAVVGNVWPSWWIVGVINLFLAFFSSTAMLLAGGLWISRYPRVLLVASWLLLVHMGIFAWDAAHGWSWRLLWQTYGYALPILIVLGGLWSIVIALRAGYLGGWYFATAGAIWLIYAASTVWLVGTAMPPVPIPIMAYFGGAALLVVPLASAACAPLALAAHRHG